MTRSIRTRLLLWITTVVVVALTGFSTAVLWWHDRWGNAEFDAGLVGLGTAISNGIQEEIGETGSLPKAVLETRLTMDVPGRVVLVLDANGTPLTAVPIAFPYTRALWPAGGLVQRRFLTLPATNLAWRVFMQRESSPVGSYAIVIAGPIDEIERQHRLLAQILLLAAPLVVLLTVSACWWAASALLRPMTLLAAQAESMTAAAVDWRLDEPAGGGEVGQLAAAFNRLLARLAAASRQQRRFMADASHELRTPVSVIQTAAEVTLDRPAREEAEYREALTIVAEQSSRLSRIVDDMFVLARADTGGYALARRLLYLDDLVAECARAVSVVAATKSIRITHALEPDIAIDGDDGLLRRLVINLLDNAVRYTPAGGSIAVALLRAGDVASIVVSDTGPGVPLADRERVFERFVRLDPARSSASGSGLGLPIARWIAEQHGGTVTLEANEAGGCRIVARISAVAPPNDTTTASGDLAG